MKLASSASAALMFATILVAAAHAGSEPSGIRGVVLNATCPGPCSIPPKPLPVYKGDNLTVIVRHLPDRVLVARLHPKDGRFGVEVPPGRYRVRAFVGDPKEQPSCWEGSVRRVLVEAETISRVRLRVRNVCVL